MRIIHITPTYFDEASVIGGGERYVDELAKSQARLWGCEVFIFSFGPKSMRFSRNGVNFRIFRSHRWKHFTLTNPFSMGHFLALRRASVIHVHQICTFVSDLAALAGRFWRIPVLGTDHGGGGAWVLNRRLPVYRVYRQVIGQSAAAAELLGKDFAGRVGVIPGGVDTDAFSPDPSVPKAAPAEILFVGRLLPHKGVLSLIEAFRLLPKDAAVLRIVGRVGDPVYFEKLQQIAAGHEVSFETGLNDLQLIEAYRRASTTVIPSVAKNADGPLPELMGFTVLESQACGTPVICSDAGPMREFIREGETGWVFPAGDTKALAKCLETAIGAVKTDKAQLAQACHSQAEQFSWNKIAKAHLQLYKDVQ